MLAGGPTETIAHFAGLMRIFDDPDRMRILLDDPANPYHLRPWEPLPVPEHNPASPLDPLPSAPTHAIPTLPVAPLHPAHLHFRPDHIHLLPAEPGPHAPLPPLDQPVDVYGWGGAGGEAATIPVPVPDQLLLQTVQLNQLENNDQVLMVPGQDGSTLHNGAASHSFDALVDAAQEVTPHDLLLAGPSTSDAIALVTSLDSAAATHTDPGATTAPLGTYVDGALQPAGTAIDFTTPSLPTVPDTNNHNGLDNPGLDAQTGGNLSLNAASIYDDHTEHSALAVMGNSYSTDAIVQINVLVDHASINAYGASTLPSFFTSGDTTQNAASIQHDDLSLSGVGQGSFGAHIAVDTVAGNFYNVSELSQVNLLGDNDAVVQSSMNTYYGVSTGQNAQINDLPVQLLNAHYDLIVVEGAYHSANLIYQTNELLTDSSVLSLDMRQDATTQSISTGNNTLTNKASIDDYGASSPAQFGGNLSMAINDLEHGKLDPELASSIPNNGSGTLHVLLVQGDFYDINAISQTNIVSNIDTVAQYSPDPHTTTSPTGASTSSTQTAATGGNALTNLAQIVTVGTTTPSYFVDGQHYQASTLIQAGFVNDQSHITTGDPRMLAAEMAQLTGLPEAALAGADDHPVVTATAATHDDLFHGVLS